MKETTTFDLLITGHEDGSVKFWDIRSGKDIQYVSLSVYTVVRGLCITQCIHCGEDYVSLSVYTVVRTMYHSVYTLW